MQPPERFISFRFVFFSLFFDLHFQVDFGFETVGPSLVRLLSDRPRAQKSGISQLCL